MSFQHNNLKKTKLSKSTCHFKIIIKENQIKTFSYRFLIIKETLDNTLTLWGLWENCKFFIILITKK